MLWFRNCQRNQPILRIMIRPLWMENKNTSSVSCFTENWGKNEYEKTTSNYTIKVAWNVRIHVKTDVAIHGPSIPYISHHRHEYKKGLPSSSRHLRTSWHSSISLRPYLQKQESPCMIIKPRQTLICSLRWDELYKFQCPGVVELRNFYAYIGTK